ncbi:MAG: tRNA-dihydrouridine synthase, partial [Gloeomargarita sp. DG02_1_bins_92]
QRMEQAGAQLITVHGRTRAQGYQGAARWEWIRRVKAVVQIPVIANGDIFSVPAAVACLELTGADGVMCSRGTLGYPFLVGEIDHFFRTGEILPPPTPEQRLLCAREHLLALWEYKGEAGLRQARKHLAWYAREFPGAAQLRQAVAEFQTLEEGLALLDRVLARWQGQEWRPCA